MSVKSHRVSGRKGDSEIHVSRGQQVSRAQVLLGDDKGYLDWMGELVAEDYLDHNPAAFPQVLLGREGWKQAFQLFWEATPGYHLIADQIREGDR
jgi:hypothetical protein